MPAPEIPEKRYFRIGEVARMLGEPAHVLRYWETEFRGVRPQKSRSGQRVYARRDVERLALIQRLLREERYTLEGARKFLKDRGADRPEGDAPPRVEQLRSALIEARALIAEGLARLDGQARTAAPQAPPTGSETS